MGAHRGKQPPRRKRLESSRLVDLATPAPPVLEVLFPCRSLALSTTIALSARSFSFAHAVCCRSLKHGNYDHALAHPQHPVAVPLANNISRFRGYCG
jgi:hypothetical protein